MSVLEKINVGIAGAVGRGGTFRETLEACGARIHAVCDIRANELEECRQRFHAEEKYADFDEMIDKSELDAVLVGTPMPFHVPQSIKALEKGVHVLCEVPSGVSIEECRDLVLAQGRSQARYMLAENYIYTRPNLSVSLIAGKGLFGEIYYAEGEYLHDVRDLCEETPWRLKWQTGLEGITYGTHSLGPILNWLKGDRIVSVCCGNTGSHIKDPRGKPYAQDSATMLGKTARGALIKIRVDLVSPRPHSMRNYQIQGTKGAYESSRGGPVDRGKIWFEELSQQPRWHDIEALAEIDDLSSRYLDEMWRNPSAVALRSGHSGGDYMVIRDFLDSLRNNTPFRVGIHEAMDMTLPGLVSQQSMRHDGAWLPVPDSREWKEERKPQLSMLFPRERHANPPAPKVPEGYSLKTTCLEDPDEERQFAELIDLVGFGLWDHDRIRGMLSQVLPNGLFVIRHEASGRIVATAQASHKPREHHPWGGEMGWVAAHPDHKRKGLGMAVSAAATARLAQAGYEHIYLLTDDFRLPAIETYLRLGFEPFLFCEGMAERWAEVMRNLGRA